FWSPKRSMQRAAFHFPSRSGFGSQQCEDDAVTRGRSERRPDVATKSALHRTRPLTTRVLARAQWKEFKTAIDRIVADASIPEDSKRALIGNLGDINRVPQRTILRAVAGVGRFSVRSVDDLHE